MPKKKPNKSNKPSKQKPKGIPLDASVVTAVSVLVNTTVSGSIETKIVADKKDKK